jgi:hypothetical protein
MANAPLSIEQLLARLAEAPPRIAAAADGLAPERLRATPADGGWSANDVLAHLRACADVWGGCIATILTQDTPTIRAVNPRTWIERTDYPALEFQPSLHAYTRQRGDLLAQLHTLPPEAWARKAIVTGAGKTLERTMQGYADWLVIHERAHLKQIERIASSLRA